MPATAGRVRMPANNRVHSSAALQTHGIWQSAIGYDPYAPDRKDAAVEPGAPVPAGTENAYDSFQGLLQLARIQSNPAADEPRGACKKCGRVGHLSYQCRNLINVAAKEEAAPVLETKAGRGEERRKPGAAPDDSGDESESDDSDSDSDVDSEMERAIAEREGRNFKRESQKPAKKSKKKSHHRSDEGSESEEEKPRSSRKKKSKTPKKSKKRRGDESSDSDDEPDDRRSRKRHRHKSRKSSRRSRKEYYSSDSSDDKRREKKRSRSRNERTQQ